VQTSSTNVRPGLWSSYSFSLSFFECIDSPVCVTRLFRKFESKLKQACKVIWQKAASPPLNSQTVSTSMRKQKYAVTDARGIQYRHLMRLRNSRRSVSECRRHACTRCRKTQYCNEADDRWIHRRSRELRCGRYIARDLRFRVPDTAGSPNYTPDRRRTFTTTPIPTQEYHDGRHSASVPNPGSVAEWLACWTEAQKGPGSNRSRDAVG